MSVLSKVYVDIVVDTGLVSIVVTNYNILKIQATLKVIQEHFTLVWLSRSHTTDT